MGREIRRVPPSWEHPVESNGHHRPVYDRSLRDAQDAWECARLEYEASTDTPLKDDGTPYTYVEWDGEKPTNPAYYRPDWSPEQATAFVVYETVSEGTPASPVFTEPEALHQWLVNQGYAPDAAARFMVAGWAPSFVMDSSGIHDGISAS